MTRRTGLIGLVLLATLAGLLFRLHGLGRQDLWLDELWSLEASAGRGQADQDLPTGRWLAAGPGVGDLTHIDPENTVADVGRHLAPDSHPPGFYILLRLWRGVVGDSPWALRLLTVCLSTGGVVAVAWLTAEVQASVQPDRTRRWPYAAALAALVAAVSAPHIFYAQELRMYAATALTNAAAAALAVRAIRQRDEWHDDMAMFGVMALASMYVHYLSAIPLAVTAAAMLTLRHLRWGVVATLIVTAAIYWFTWGDGMLAQRAALGHHMGAQQPVASSTAGGAVWFAGCTAWLTQIWGRMPWGVPGAFPLADVLCGVAFAAASVALLRRYRTAVIWMVVVWAWCGWAILALGGGKAALPRYQLFTLPAVAVLLAMTPTLFARREKWAASAIGGLAAIGLALGATAGDLTGFGDPYARYKPRWSQLVAGMKARETGGPRPVVLCAALPQNRYLLGGTLMALTHHDGRPQRQYLLLDHAPLAAQLPADVWLFELTPQYGRLDLPGTTEPQPWADSLGLPLRLLRLKGEAPTVGKTGQTTTATSPSPAR